MDARGAAGFLTFRQRQRRRFFEQKLNTIVTTTTTTTAVCFCSVVLKSEAGEEKKRLLQTVDMYDKLKKATAENTLTNLETTAALRCKTVFALSYTRICSSQ